MKVLFTIATLLVFCSCIKLETANNFEGAWRVLDSQFSPLADEVEMNLSDGVVTIVADGDHIGSGDYVFIDDYIVFGWTLDFHDIYVLMLDASLADSNTLALKWKPIGFWYPYTSLFVRQK